MTLLSNGTNNGTSTDSRTDKTIGTVVPSYVLDAWWAPADDSGAQSVLDASTGAEVARVSSDGLDLAAVVAHARTVGQASLGELTFHQRAILLKKLGQYLGGVKEELYELSARTGATRYDSMVDIDGGIGVLFTLSSKGRREMPNSQVYIDGDVEALSRDGSFSGQHIYTRIPGVACQINAFNFPVWGMLEKLAPAFIAGVPTIVKPATPTGYVTEAVVRHILASGILPPGSLQLISGSARNLIDHLDYRDLVAFTGSAGTARTLKAHSNVVEGGVRFTSETDSLNAAILGPDAAAGTAEFDAYVASVVTEMTSKAGQKCTSIRRLIVPAGRRDQVVAAVSERMARRVTLGDPRTEGVTMGPLASTGQRDEVLASVARLIDGGGRIVMGSQDLPTGADPEGAFMAPILLAFHDPESPAVHEIEAFGPVASIIEYTDLDHAVALAARGGGSLVTTVATHHPDVARALVLGIAAHHGRVLMLDRVDARSSTGHGSPVPHLVHGGPGRAGGSEELGGIRSVLHHMQRTAIQGSPDMLTAITGEWHTGAAVQTGIHPFRKSLAELRVGDQTQGGPRVVTLADITAFAEDTGDKFYAHTDAEAAAANPFFPGIVAHGYLLVSWAAGLFVDAAPGPVLANSGLEKLRFVTPVSPGDSIRVTLTAKRITPRETDEYGEVCWDAVLHNQNDEVVATYDVLTLVAKE
ncbi:MULTISPECIES: phenylacetic acid degradation bifunctional protein PaaZ [Cryobacterium]|uniref:Phenylacetic acid degradation bifunctional protein PaaZ n=1 Tax=Cryobacterium breve TaxID=1259258 RepID=A0ABY2J5E2_9MICO|nr:MULTISPECIES: phenylacetic acid degradation bifunctional protein PaaZ [Cryobacterium]TFC95709.1 phenylacetic acid degradation bifunctional protein PaaZ [Cryobacterium sp. TmT3-12]TFD00148.1 phenylacetic acid degradation bifunctional protein PaaZ [Cryobacterium breve]